MITESIKNAVIEELGYSVEALENTDHEEHDDLTATLKDISRHGIDGGFHGFIYYTETAKFYDANIAEIVKLCDSWEQEVGEPVKNPHRISDPNEVEQDQAKNWFAWFAAESVAHEAANRLEYA